ncbi:hypothetical protein D6810_01495 [Candidatus Dojkabacteria bacterium]|uniref:Uncharacterized protein n=1 Tax=Candidatus Dojkabacteria bacterium TaxID=2099670 RepID=A0A3M0YYT9_9BACT|nr:MAG: hypothetical protein D6810_01495 [Candidatus Dojkabacteria bacterium]
MQKKDLVSKMNIFFDVIEEIKYSTIYFYNGSCVRMKIDENEEILRIYNAYHFKDHLKQCGFFFDSTDNAWTAHPVSLVFVDKAILKRLLLSTPKTDILEVFKFILSFSQKMHAKRSTSSNEHDNTQVLA